MIKADPFESAKKDELTVGRESGSSDAPTIAMLCQWHKAAQQAMDEFDESGGQTAYQNDVGERRTFPQIRFWSGGILAGNQTLIPSRHGFFGERAFFNHTIDAFPRVSRVHPSRIGA